MQAGNWRRKDFRRSTFCESLWQKEVRSKGTGCFCYGFLRNILLQNRCRSQIIGIMSQMLPGDRYVIFGKNKSESPGFYEHLVI